MQGSTIKKTDKMKVVVSNNNDNCDYDYFPSLDNIDMTRHYNSIICARRGGPTFLEAVKIGPG